MELLIFGLTLVTLSAIAHNVSSFLFSDSIMKCSQTRHIYKVTAILFVPLHEISHCIFCVLFRHKIRKVQLFSFDFSKGTLGYVRHSWDKQSIYQCAGCFFIAIAPLLVCAGIVYFTIVQYEPFQLSDLSFLSLSTKGSVVYQSLWVLTPAAYNAAHDGEGALRLLIATTACFHCIPSKQDFKNAGKSSLLVVGLSLAFLVGLSYFNIGNVYELSLNTNTLELIYALLFSTALVIILSQISWLVLFTLSKLLRNKDEGILVDTE